MPSHDAQECGEQFLARRKLRTKEAPFGMTMQLFPAFIRLIDRQKQRRRIGYVNQHRQTKLAALLPDAVPPWIVDFDQWAVGIFVFESELLEDFQAASAALFR